MTCESPLYSMHPYMLETLSKWSSKIQAVTPSALLPPGRNALFSKSSQRLKSAVQLIDETLTDQSKLLARTRIRRGKGVRVGSDSPQEEDDEKNEQTDEEMFDDTDFYQQLLRDVIDGRGNDIGEHDDWMVTQKQKKAKKTVDTKASKGRKVRQVSCSYGTIHFDDDPTDQIRNTRKDSELHGARASISNVARREGQRVDACVVRQEMRTMRTAEQDQYRVLAVPLCTNSTATIA
jgi:hypothetical protein